MSKRARLTRRILALAASCLLAFTGTLSAQTIVTISGNGTNAFAGDGGPALSASHTLIWGIAHDSAGNVFVAEPDSNRVRKISPDGTISTYAGNGSSTSALGDGGPAVAASMTPISLAVDGAGNLYLTDGAHNRIRKVTPAGIITTIAGTGIYGNFGDGGQAIKASFKDFMGLSIDPAGNLYVTSNNRVRKITPGGVITAFAGTGAIGFSGEGGKATSAVFNDTRGTAADAAGNVYIADQGNARVWKVNASGTISTFAGGGHYQRDVFATASQLTIPLDVGVDSLGNVYIANIGAIYKVSPAGLIARVAGYCDFACGEYFAGDGGAARTASLHGVHAIDLDGSDNLLIADSMNYRVRRAGASGPIPQPVGTDAMSSVETHGVAGRANAVAVGDFTGDGRNDVALVTAYANAASPDDSKLFLYVQQANGTLGAPVTSSFGSTTTQQAGVVMTDLDHDGRKDVVLSHDAGFTVFPGNAGGSLSGVPFIFSGQEPSYNYKTAIASLDLNLDGNADIVRVGYAQIGGNGIWIHLGNGAGGFSPPSFRPWPCFPDNADRTFGLSTGDFNGDGLPDIAGGCGTETLLLNNGLGGFTVAARTGRWSPLPVGLIGTADLNDDGRDDFFTRVPVIPGALGFYLQDTTGRLEGPVAMPMEYSPLAYAAGDVNGDGRVDLVGWLQGYSAMGFLQGAETGFAPMTKYWVGSGDGLNNGSSLTVADVNSDGCRDVVTVSDNRDLVIVHGKCVASATATDVDGDGKGDLRWIAGAGRLDAWLGADASQSRPVRIPAGWNVVASGDFDGDLKSDLLLRQCRLGGNLLVPATPTKGARSVASLPAAWRLVASGDFDADGIADLLWQHADGATLLWPSADARRQRRGAKLARGWDVATVGDFDGDGRDDIFWRHQPTGANLVWRAGGLLGAQRVTAVLNKSWRVAGSGDLDGDGRDEVMWRDSATGQNVSWPRAEHARSKTLDALADPAWSLVAVTDFDGDRRADFAWHNQRTGQNMLWKRGQSGLRLQLARADAWARPAAAGACPR